MTAPGWQEERRTESSNYATARIVIALPDEKHIELACSGL
jgi:hypothetical protein